ncbi:MAG TPA: ABC transporter substrate-binding protein [Xanthobacteraceae bacterium]
MIRSIPSRLLRLGFGLGCLWGSSLAAAAAPPQRVVSFNICADQLVVALADPAQIVALSPYATDPTLSAVADEARAYRRVEWQAESTIPLEPDLVLVGPRDRSLTQRLLRALGFRVVVIDLVESLSAAREQISAVAALLGHPERGDAALARLDAARSRLAERRRGASTALLVGQGGYVEGRRSLAAALMTEAGLNPPPAAPTGLGGFVPLETLVMMRPDFLVLHSAVAVPHDQGSIYLTHPAVQALYPADRRLVLPSRFTLCGGPALVAGLGYLAEQVPKLGRGNP